MLLLIAFNSSFPHIRFFSIIGEQCVYPAINDVIALKQKSNKKQSHHQRLIKEFFHREKYTQQLIQKEDEKTSLFKKITKINVKNLLPAESDKKSVNRSIFAKQDTVNHEAKQIDQEKKVVREVHNCT